MNQGLRRVARMSLHKFVSLRRTELKLTQRAIALMLDVTVQHISNIETGRTIPSDAFCVKLAPILQVKPEVLGLMAHRERAAETLPLDPVWNLFTGAIEIALKGEGR